MTSTLLRALADLIDAGHPCDYIGIGEQTVTVVANPISAARWQERCPNGVLPGTRVVVQAIPVPAIEVGL